MLEYQVITVERDKVLSCLREAAKDNWEPVFALPGTWKWATAIYFKREVVVAPEDATGGTVLVKVATSQFL